jgi:glycosyltransferase involved in cell wall biosynthesis
MTPDYFIFIPAYNVAATLADVLERIPSAVMERAEVLVIDDGSKDDTRGAYENFVGEAGAVPNTNTASPNPNGAVSNTKYASHLQYMRFEFNRGYGAVVKKGISEGLRSGAKYIACLHGDGQYPAEQLGEFFAYLESARNQPEVSTLASNQPEASGLPELALVQGSRHAIAGGAKAGNMPLHKRIGGAILTALENIAFRQKLTDRHSGFIVYNAEFLKTLNLAKLSPSFDIDLEIISIADARGWRLAELPIPTRYAGEKSNLNVVTYGLRVLRQILRRFCLR